MLKKWFFLHFFSKHWTLKIKISKIGLRHILSWPKLGLEPKFHDPGTFGGFGKRKQTDIQYFCFISIDIYFNNIHIILKIYIKTYHDNSNTNSHTCYHNQLALNELIEWFGACLQKDNILVLKYIFLM